ncbi:MAG: NAD(P)H-hydrate epimerase [Dehalococcoidia bacterium]|nr:NAD(P)H-hydrate epimerase [Dehalococcoidia bacterium]
MADADTGPSTRLPVEVAGFQVALRTLELVESTDASVLVLAGPGGTGAVGVAAARHLANRGVPAVVVTARRPAEASGPLGHQLLALAETRARVLPFSAAFDVAAFDLVVDAVLGRGMEGAPRMAVMGLVRAAEAARGPVLSVDVPSGVEADSGETPGAHVRPSSTLALGLPARGLLGATTGDLVLADIGWTAGVYARAGLVVPTVFGRDARVPLRRDPGRLD